MLLRLTAFMLLIPFATGLLGGGLGWNQNIGENIFENVVENILEGGRNQNIGEDNMYVFQKEY